MDYKTLVKELKKGNISPVYFFYGDEKYSIEQATQHVIDATVQQDVKDFNFDLFYAGETDTAKILDVAKSYPMMAPKRTVVIKEIQKFSASHLDVLAKYSGSPTPTTCMVLVASKGGMKGKSYETLKKNTVSLEFRQLYDDKVEVWIKHFIEEQNMEITQPAIQLLYGYVGNSQLNIVNELEKVFLNLGNRKRIDVDDVQSVVGFSKEFNVFDLLNAVGDRNLSRSLFILDKLLEHGEKAVSIIIRLTNYFSTILKCIEMQNLRKSDKEIMQAAAINYYFLQKYKNQARNFTVSQVEQIFKLLLEADLHVKISYQTHKLILELLIYKIVKL